MTLSKETFVHFSYIEIKTFIVYDLTYQIGQYAHRKGGRSNIQGPTFGNTIVTVGVFKGMCI